MMKKKLKKFLYAFVFPYGGLLLVRLLSATYRVRIIGAENEKMLLEEGQGLVYASWHQRFFPGIIFFSTRKPIAIIISKSKDGEMAARAVDVLGWHAVRGSSSEGGKEALEEIKTLARSGYRVGHIVDGPQGPFGKVKPGLIRIAQHASLAVVPTITSGQHLWVFNSWDRFMVPKPFSRVIIRFGTPIEVPEDLDEEKFQVLKTRVERDMDALYKDTDAIWTSRERIRSVYA